MSRSVKNKFICAFIVMSLFLIRSYPVIAQCTYDIVTPIPDNGSTSIHLIVSGLADADLASPGQGICGVEIEFEHEYLGDLTMSLISPNGTRVDMIGPTTTTISPTNLSTWDIDFVPCADAASPDPGFTSIWSNEQAWQALTPYSGTYHPQQGCLEDFDTGSANGVWQLLVEDHDEFQLGSIISVTILFCDPTGINCLPCMPNAGSLSPTLIEVCSGENIQSTDISIDYGGDVPSPLLYTYAYVFVSGNTILQSGTNFSLTPPVGNYSICGLSYLTSDSTAITDLIDAGDYSQLSDAVSQGAVCAELTASCVTLNVTGRPDTIHVTGDLCGGEIFSYGGQDYFTDGVFYQVKNGPGLCDTTVEIRIHPRALTVMVNSPDTLFCGDGDVMLEAMATGGPGPFTYQWSTINGNITSPVNGPSITVNQSGQYFVEVSDGVCEGSGSANVVAGPGYPQAVFSGGTISCTRPVVNINPIYSPAGASVLWNGPMGFMSTQPNIGVTVPGTYTLNITNTVGCTTVKSIDIGIDTATAPVNIILIGKDCQNGQATLGTANQSQHIRYNWTGPNGFTSTFYRPVITDPGIYNVTVEFSNGCTRSGSFDFLGDFDVPDIMVTPDDTINCNETLTLMVSSGTPGAVFSWRGPNNFMSTQSSISVTQAGRYFADVSAPNGCSNFDTIDIVLGDDIFDYQIITDTLTCSKSMVTIGVETGEADTYDWINYSGPDDDQSMITVDASGLYTLLMTNSATGCEVVANILVEEDIVIPWFEYTLDTITCLDPIADLAFVPQPGFTYTTVYWELPDLSIVQGTTLSSAQSGVHKLVAISPNGCMRTRNINIPIDTLSPFFILNADTLMCRDTAVVFAQSLDSVSTYQWDGPGIIENIGLSIHVDVPGWYHLVATGPNGCPSNYSILVDSNFALPVYTLLSDTLRCDRDAELAILPDASNNTYQWFDPNMLLLSTDSLVLVNQPGVYTVQIEGQNQCIAFDTVTLDPLLYPMVSLASDTFTCIESMVEVEANVDIDQYTLAWVNTNGDTLSQNISMNVSTAGPFITSVTGQNACTTRDTIYPPYDTLAPTVMIEMIGEIRCQNRTASLNASSSGPQPLSYFWTTGNGMITSDPALAMIDVQDTGRYILQVTHQVNGCIAVDSIMVSEHPDAITNAIITATFPECHGDGNAAIIVEEIEGGVGVINFQLDDGPPQTQPVFGNLPAGSYLLTMIDEANCIFDTLVQVDTTVVFTVDAGPDTEIYLGESTVLMGMTDIPVEYFYLDEWGDFNGSLCTSCSEEEVSPLETTSYIYQVTSSTGCVLADTVTVFVLEQAKFFIPNVFSPNGDGVNDEVRITSPGGIDRVLRWVIYDRWGNAAFGQTDFDPMDTAVYWDGRATTGSFYNPGVFPYIVEIQLINGDVQVYHGEITLLR